MEKSQKYGIVLVNTGTASEPTSKAARAFTKSFLGSARIAPIPLFLWRIVVALFIAPLRSRASAEKYKTIWTEQGSPLSVAHKRLEAGLSRQLIDAGASNAIVRCGMCYSNPHLHEVLAELKQEGCTQLIVLPLFPQSAYSTTGDVHDRLHQALKALEWDVDFTMIDNYHDNPTYVNAVAASIKHAGFQIDSKDRLVIAYHSIPLRDAQQGDTYELQTGASSLLIAESLGISRERWTIGYQSRFHDGRYWLAPFAEEVLDRYAHAGPRKLFYVCPGFATDCLETLYDVEQVLKPAYYDSFARQAHGFDPEFVYVGCLGGTKAHLAVLQDVLLPYLKEREYAYYD